MPLFLHTHSQRSFFVRFATGRVIRGSRQVTKRSSTLLCTAFGDNFGKRNPVDNSVCNRFTGWGRAVRQGVRPAAGGCAGSGWIRRTGPGAPDIHTPAGRARGRAAARFPMAGGTARVLVPGCGPRPVAPSRAVPEPATHRVRAAAGRDVRPGPGKSGQSPGSGRSPDVRGWAGTDPLPLPAFARYRRPDARPWT